MIKKNDVILIAVLLLLSLLSFFVLRKDNTGGKQVVISVNNKQKNIYSLNKDQTVTIKDYGENTVVIKDGYCYVSSADCPDQICKNHKKISEKKENIICLPNRMVVEIK